MQWKTMQGYILDTDQMDTNYLFNSVKMMYNHLAELLGFPTFWFTKEYKNIYEKCKEDPQKHIDTLKGLIIELEKREDIEDRHIEVYSHIKLTLTGGFHKVLFDKLSEMGIEVDRKNTLENSVKKLLERSNSDTKQLTKSNTK